MTVARRKIINPADTPWYHCISKCARALPLFRCNGSYFQRWMELRLRFLSKLFAISVAGHTFMDNHMHLLLRINTKEVEALSNEEVARRWAELFPPKDSKRQKVKDLQAWIKKHAADAEWVKTRRERLVDIGWLHKCLKEPLAHMINQAEGKKGTVFQGRYKSIAILGLRALLNTCIYIDLNPVAAGIVTAPEASPFTSIAIRFRNVIRQGRAADLAAAYQECGLNKQRTAELEQSLWLLEIEDRSKYGARREGMTDEITLAQYFLLVDYTGRKLRDGKASMSPEVAQVMERLKISEQLWLEQQRSLASGTFRGNYFATSREKLREIAERRGKRHLVNCNGCSTL
ncbi:MAG: hypothetical protein RLY14_1534 [Planctomycetota bacterium]|jgi:hypothetical protein